MYLFIVNPQSGNGQTMQKWQRIEKQLREQQIPYMTLGSMSRFETRDFIANQIAQNKLKAVAVIGGDGTINSVIQELANTNIPLAIFPAGSGNDTAKMFRLTDKPTKFIAGLLNERTTTIDLLNVNDHFGMSVAGTGIDSIIGNRVNQSFYKPIFNKLRIGSLSYTIAAILSLLTFKPFNGQLTIDGNTERLTNAWLIATGNTTTYGGGLNICPQAIPTDGVLNLTYLHNARRLHVLLRLFPALLKGGLILKKGVHYNEGKEIIIETDRPIPVIVDGEIITSTPLQLCVHEKALRLILTT